MRDIILMSHIEEALHCATANRPIEFERYLSDDDRRRLEAIYDRQFEESKVVIVEALIRAGVAPRHRAPFGLPSISPSGIPLREQTGAIPSVFIDEGNNREQFERYLEVRFLDGFLFSDYAQTAAHQSVPDRVRNKLDKMWKCFVESAYQTIKNHNCDQLKEAPITEPQDAGATPLVRIDDDDSNDAHLGEADTGQIEIFTETNKGDQE